MGTSNQLAEQLLAQYGNTVSLIDATYKTTKYELALFFICVRTNVGHSVVGEFIVQSESADNIEEALQMLKSWNSDGNPIGSLFRGRVGRSAS